MATTVHNSSGTLADVRKWAREQGYDLGDRGRIPPHIIEAYSAAVRTWAREQNMQIGTRGRIPREVISAFNASKIRKSEAKPTNDHKPARRTISQVANSRSHTTKEIREAAKRAGYDVGDRGRLPRQVVREFVVGKI